MLYKKKSPLLIFLLPGLVLMILFLYKPFIENIINSFYDMTSVIKMPGQEWNFLGLANYKKLFSDPKIRIAISNTLKMMALAVVFQVGIAFLLAVLVNQIKTGQQIFRTVYFFPIVISASAIGLLFKLFYNYNGGMLNQLLLAAGKKPINWLSTSRAFVMVSIPIIWSYVGFYFVIILTGLNAISEDIYEAAAIDGCSRWKQVFYITIPLIRGVMCTCITLAVTGAIKVFDLPWVIVPKGAPQGVTHFLGTYMYEQTFSISNIDYGSTIALLIVILGVIVSKIISKLMKPDGNLE
ncbi:MAG: sugar ABC transporter permease [Lachnospiraceae bacterium]|jgi:raffinose/stachyose/melibiose transport system permease protein|nr:sugar ABC transporter permease [Lachnospiraceae bacterium]